MLIFALSFLAGILTILAPCVLPVLPVILGGTLNESNYKRVATIILSFVVSIVAFTFLLKVSTAFISIDQQVWKIISGVILIVFGVISIFPELREQGKSLFNIRSISGPKESKSVRGQVLLGASLGPIFTTCSPTYTLIIATILPLSISTGTISIVLYALGLGFAVGMVAVFGKTLVKKLNIVSDGDGWFKKILGIIIILTGIAIMTGFDKKIETAIIDAGRFGITGLEQSLVDNFTSQQIGEGQSPSPQNEGSYIDYDMTRLPSLSGDIVLFFHADRCPTCQQAQKNFLASGIPAGLTIMKVNYDKETELKRKYAILTQTSFVAIKNDGTLITRWVGGLTIDDVLENIKKAKIADTTIGSRIASDQIAKAYFAGGCFRCMEGPFESLAGVKEVISGYIGGDADDARYDSVSSGKTRHKEAVEVIYDPALIHYDELLDSYRRQIDPTDAGGQFADRGSQYQTAIYYTSEQEKVQALSSKQKLTDSKKFSKAIVVEIVPATPFYPAESYHQDYYKTNANHYNSYKKGSGREDFITTTWKDSPAKVSPDPWRKTAEEIQAAIDNLSPEQKKILFAGGTETPFQNDYRDNHEAGIYVDIIDGTPLFASTDKFDSGTGRPSFSKPINQSMVGEHTDSTFGIKRTEVKSSTSSGHLGHVFDDGPADQGGQRYCINSAALKFIPVDAMESAGYGSYLSLFKTQ